MKASPAQAQRLHTFAHDLRNRLIGLQQVLHHLAGDEPTAEIMELQSHGERQYFKALQEVERLLDDLAVDRHTLKIDPTTVDLGDLVRRQADLLSFRFERKRQPLILELEDELNVTTDERILSGILDALLSNASKFSPVDTGIVVRSSRNDGRIRLEVCDHGVGLSPADLDQLFLRFALLSSKPTAGEAQGRSTLSRMRDQARAMGGELSAVSEGPGHGTTFILDLPSSVRM